MIIEGGRRKEEQEGGRRKNALSVALVALVVLLVLVLLVLLVLPLGGAWRPQGGPLGTPYLFITGVIIFYYVLTTCHATVYLLRAVLLVTVVSFVFTTACAH